MSSKRAKTTGYDLATTEKTLIKMGSHPMMEIGAGRGRSTFPKNSSQLYGHILKETCHLTKQ